MKPLRYIANILRPANKKLSTLMLYTTDLCDSSCKHCLIWTNRPVKYLAKEKIVEIMKSKCISKHTQVGLEGGEFLLHPQAMDILKWFSKNHPNFALLSNCLRPDVVIDAVKKYPPQRLLISLDGTKETYLHMRGKDGYDGVISVIENCRNSVPVSLMFTLSPYNTLEDLAHVEGIARKYNISVGAGIYHDIPLFSTVEKAHETGIGQVTDTRALTYKMVKETLSAGIVQKKELLKEEQSKDMASPKHDSRKISDDKKFRQSISALVKDDGGNYGWLLLYNEWRMKRLKLKCFSILDSLVIHPNGDVPICQNLEIKLGNVFQNSLDEIFNSANSQLIQKKHVHGCNQCWLNFHRNHDVDFLRRLEKIFPKKVIELFYGKYFWTDDHKMTYKKFLKNKKSDKLIS